MRDQPAWLTDLGNTVNGVFAVDLNQRILTWNAGAEALLGHRPAEAIGRYCYEVLGSRLPSGEKSCRPSCDVQQGCRRGELCRDFDVVATAANGTDVRATVSITAIAANGTPLVLHVVRPTRPRDRSDEVLDDILSRLEAAGLSQRLDESEGEALSCCNGRAAPQGTASASVLSSRELEVLDLLRRGCSTQNIAGELNISVLTVRSHVRNMLRKTGLHSRAEIVSTTRNSRA